MRADLKSGEECASKTATPLYWLIVGGAETRGSSDVETAARWGGETP